MDLKPALRKGAELGVVLAAISTLVLVGCGGGGGGGGAKFGGGAASGVALNASDVSSLLSDQQNNFTGGWLFIAAAGSTVAAGETIAQAVAAASGVVDANENTVIVNSLNNYTQTYAEQRLAITTWGANAPSASYALPQAGSWISYPLTASIINVLNGTYTYTLTGLTTDTVSVTRTNLAGKPIACSDVMNAPVTCPVPGSYPAGASSYTSYSVPSADEFVLFGSYAGVPTAIPIPPVTNSTGVALVAIPTLPLPTICDPFLGVVYQAISPAPAAGQDNVNIFSAASCSSADITTALGAAVMGTAYVSARATGNGTVPSVIRVQTTATAILNLNNTIYGLRAGAVYAGYMNQAGVTSTSVDLNKIAVNAELVANGLTPIP